MLSGFSVCESCINCRYSRILKHNPVLEDGEFSYKKDMCCIQKALENEGDVEEVMPDKSCDKFEIKDL